MKTSRLPRMLFITLSVVSVVLSQLAGIAPAQAATAAVTAPNSTVGSVVKVASTFTAPSWSGSFMLDTEVFNASGARVGQFTEVANLSANSSSTRSYNWNTAGLSAGTYTFQQGLFKSDWSASLGWNAFGGSVVLSNLNAPTPVPVISTAWNVSSTVSGSTITASFKAPSILLAQDVILDTEVHNSSGVKVAQWYSSAAARGGSSFTKTHTIDSSKWGAGTYTVKQGVFTKAWASKILFASTAKYTKSATVTTAAPTTTAAPATTTTIKPTTTTNAPTTSASPIAATGWAIDASASGTGSVQINSSFTAPSNFAAGTVQLDTEVINAAGAKVAQFAEPASMSAGQNIKKTYTWNTDGVAGGTYTVRQGVFTPDWTTNHIWNGSVTQITVGASAQSTTTTTAVKSTTTTTAVKSPTTTAAPVVTQPSSGNPLVSNNGFYANPYSSAANQAKAWKDSRPADAALMQRIADGGAATWLGAWNWDVRGDVNNVVNAASNQGQTPVFVAYNIPNRDCGSYSAGGVSSADAYRTWINSIASGIGSKKAAVILEPDALAQLDCLGSSAQAERLSMMKYAVNTLGALDNTSVYIDAGHSAWVGASTMANRLESAGVANARGFALNVSNFRTTADNAAYGEQISNLLGGKHYVIDTSRNGNGSNGEWCNPMGRALGATPTTNTGRAHADGYIWIKQPGESDGECNGGPSAGTFWSEYALGLARQAWS